MKYAFVPLVAGVLPAVLIGLRPKATFVFAIAYSYEAMGVNLFPQMIHDFSDPNESALRDVVPS
jgi:hypothetical protein